MALRKAKPEAVKDEPEIATSEHVYHTTFTVARYQYEPFGLHETEGAKTVTVAADPRAAVQAAHIFSPGVLEVVWQHPADAPAP